MSNAAPASYPATPRTTPTRARERARYDHETVHTILDTDYICHLGFVSADGAPVVLPTLYTRVGETLYMHGSTGSRPLRDAAEGLRVCATVTRTDGLVLARSGFHHSINYRSVVAHGTAHRVTDPEEHRTALDAIIDRIVPGRSADCRPATAKELAQTAVLRLGLEEVSAKTRTGGVNDDAEDLDLPHWAGVIPVTRTLGTPIPDPDTPEDLPLPTYLRHLLRS
ncbi:pyridoxamine 5'-phosphate oxidase family protein [Nocardiopsis gilva YIM 90087]|uniref:Pyridoxamine 5'-phosphate oxidase family protein n=1 Tax=Nocardiopsis gilva YIM 90087 TaxID=1235441 RepID=A0A223S6Q7_9ACTN|nr:pyridoxamine 5'-phosphate oxidase family protein [Nocardiopsis gilva]ASU83782.1 pyridoxamine 5'-phosphate oxidase family protein [Nocardiopsis gilva YIM 90087]